jgi:hypothetical protein
LSSLVWLSKVKAWAAAAVRTIAAAAAHRKIGRNFMAPRPYLSETKQARKIWRFGGTKETKRAAPACLQADGPGPGIGGKISAR